MRALRLHGTRDVRLDAVGLPRSRPDEALVKVYWSGVCGTDIHAYQGADEHEAGGLQGPITLGHEVAGIVVESPDEHKWPSGARVTVDPAYACGSCPVCESGRTNHCPNMRICGYDEPGGLADYVAVPLRNLIRLPDEIPLKSAAMVEPLSCALHALRRVGLGANESLLVVGGGFIGLGAATIARTLGARAVMVCEPNPERQAIASQLGVDEVFPPEEAEARLAHGCHASTRDGLVVVEAAGTQEALSLAIRCSPAAGRIAVIGLHNKRLTLDADVLLGKELSLTWSLGALREDFSDVIGLLTEGRLNPQVHVSETSADQLSADRFERLIRGQELKPLVKFHSNQEPEDAR